MMKKKRMRGGASFICPRCRSVTRVKRTKRDKNEIVRERECVRCHARFETIEIDSNQLVEVA